MWSSSRRYSGLAVDGAARFCNAASAQRADQVYPTAASAWQWNRGRNAQRDESVTHSPCGKSHDNCIPICRQRHSGRTTTARGLGGQAGSFGMAVAAQSSTALDVSYASNLPEFYPNWIPVDTRLTPHGNHVRMMTHLHGGFVNADSDGNPAITPSGSAVARHRASTTATNYRRCRPHFCGFTIMVWRDASQRVCRTGRWLHSSRPVRHWDRAQPDRHSGRSV